jgi:PAS domain S-box-containing protein
MRSTLDHLQRIFIEPPQSYGTAIHHKSRLLSIFLLVMIFIFTSVDITYVLTVPGYAVPWYGYVFLLISYALNRWRYYKIASGLVVFMFPAVIFFSILSGQANDPVASLSFLVLGLIVASILLSPRGVVLLAFVNLFGILMLPRLLPQAFPGLSVILAPLAVLTLRAALQLISPGHRDQVESDRRALLRQSEERYRLVSSVISDYTFSNVQNENGDIVLNWVAGAFEQISGYTLEEFNARGGWVCTVHPDDLDQDAHDMELLRHNQQVISELRTIHKDGTIRWVKSYAHPVWDEEKNQLVGIYGAVQDITDRKRIEHEREDLIHDLEAKNQELEQFTYTVSHDLKAPLITIKGFLGFLGVDVQARDKKRIEADIQRINEAADRMHELLTDLLELSRIGRKMNAPEMISSESLVNEVIEIMNGRLRERGVEVIVKGEFQKVYGDRQRLLEVVQNLMDNAAKFMGDQLHPLIEIGQDGRAENGYATFFVRDNGIGIAPEFHERVFGLFNRLNPGIEGTGIGLALVKRIVEFHGGRVWIQSETGSGATFYFTLPTVPPISA